MEHIVDTFIFAMSAPRIGFRRSLAAALAAIVLCTAAPATAADPAYPQRIIKMLVPFPAGNTADIVARMLAERLGARMGQPVIVENKAGAAGSIAVEAVSKAPPDGYTLLVTTSSPLVINPSLYRKLPYDVERDLVAIAMVGSLPAILVANPGVPASNVAELVTYLRKNPGKASYASNGAGSFAHVAMEVFKMSAGLDLVHVPYRGNAQSETDLVAGHVPLMFSSLATSAPLVAAGKLKALAVTSRVRSPFAAGVPAMSETGLPELRDFEVTYWVGVLAPAGTPSAIVKRLNDEINGWLQTAEFKDRLAARKIEASRPMAPEEISKLIAAEKTRWAKVLRDAKVEPQEF